MRESSLQVHSHWAPDVWFWFCYWCIYVSCTGADSSKSICNSVHLCLYFNKHFQSIFIFQISEVKSLLLFQTLMVQFLSNKTLFHAVKRINRTWTGFFEQMFLFLLMSRSDLQEKHAALYDPGVPHLYVQTGNIPWIPAARSCGKHGVTTGLKTFCWCDYCKTILVKNCRITLQKNKILPRMFGLVSSENILLDNPLTPNVSFLVRSFL